MRVLARDGVAKVHADHGAAAGRLVRAACSPCTSRTSGVSINGARRWIGPGQFQFQPSELMKLALVLYCATLLAKRPRPRARPDASWPSRCCSSSARRCLLVFTQPDLGTALVIVFTVGAMLVAAGIPMRKLG